MLGGEHSAETADNAVLRADGAGAGQLLFGLGKANLLERLYNLQSESQDLTYL